jgi:hypothetical protein
MFSLVLTVNISFVVYNAVWSSSLLSAFESIVLLHLRWRQHILVKH